MRESTVENYLVRRCREEGIQCYKFVSPSCRGVPDRVLIFPMGLVAFLELKAPGKKPTPLQVNIHRRMEGNHANVAWVDTKQGVDSILATWKEKDSA